MATSKLKYPEYLSTMSDIPSRVEDSVHIYEPSDISCGRNLMIRNKLNGQKLDVHRADVPELADSLEEMANMLRKAYAIEQGE